MNFTETISMIAIITSLLSLFISFLNFRRDKYKVIVDLDWDSGQHHIGMRSNVVETWGKLPLEMKVVAQLA